MITDKLKPIVRATGNAFTFRAEVTLSQKLHVGVHLSRAAKGVGAQETV